MIKRSGINIVAGVLFIIAGVVIWLYVGGYLMFFNGLVTIVTAIQGAIASKAMIPATNIVIAICKVLFAAPVGSLCAVIPCGIGKLLIG